MNEMPSDRSIRDHGFDTWRLPPTKATLPPKDVATADLLQRLSRA